MPRLRAKETDHIQRSILCALCTTDLIQLAQVDGETIVEDNSDFSEGADAD